MKWRLNYVLYFPSTICSCSLIFLFLCTWRLRKKVLFYVGFGSMSLSLLISCSYVNKLEIINSWNEQQEVQVEL